MTIEDLLSSASNQLRDQGYLHGEREAGFMLGKILQKDSAWLNTHPEETIAPAVADQLQKMVNERLRGCPLGYILGEQPFMGLKLRSDKRGLIPRPETEFLVELSIKHIKEFGLQEKKFLEIGTGSGPIAISLKKFFPTAAVTATDISDDALELAEENATTHEVDVEFIESDLFTDVPKQKYDFIIANLPYVPTERLAFITDQILDWEPMIAIEAGSDGLKYITPFIEQLGRHLSPTGLAAIEFWHTHGQPVKELAKKHLPNHELIVEKDLAGFDRYAFFLPLKV
ncbi:MAG: peptide chain release factor N(5)-glutamine methyltransferase [Patescibacteria group bacterium]